MIELYDLSKSFDSNQVINNLTIKIGNGSVFGLVGPNGSGKSTLLRLLAGIIKADKGKILYDGKEVYEDPEVKQDILLISDDPFYFSYASLNEMKEFYRVWYPNFDEKTYYELLHLFKLIEYKPLKNFSKGMKKQALLCIALAICPKYLFLDEVFDGLDPLMRLAFKRSLNDLMAKKRMTVIISSHNLRELEDICDSFGLIDNGKVKTSGSIIDVEKNIHKIQLAFKEELTRDAFADLDLLFFKKSSRVINIVAKGNLTQVKEKLKLLDPLMIEVLPVNLEEIFIYEISQEEL